jgi:hypothetical protein
MKLWNRWSLQENQLDLVLQERDLTQVGGWEESKWRKVHFSGAKIPTQQKINLLNLYIQANRWGIWGKLKSERFPLYLI